MITILINFLEFDHIFMVWDKGMEILKYLIVDEHYSDEYSKI